MPTYEYACKNCGETIEVFQSFADKPLKKHKECGGALQKVFHARGIVFKGGGFYATDSKPSSSSKGESKGDAKTDSKSDSKSGSDTSTSSSSDSKPAKSTEKAKAATPSSSSDRE
jgi:putative FmdB family regulatory protein